ncbi:DUF368 domain-containing protein [Marinitoga litoralis]|uniref:DUF368 domain-containing protein n=1 Tax=Marinitoga litoralis TaxID=570855 RepID=UPI00195FF9C8|nr:DUF368 domain-containing protein [Marinitoga litoralis]MBM7558824.1 putative membrane protein [Marinitoga litoralis]
MKDFILGLLMGIANLLPGISGGTIAAISGRYEIILKAASDFVSLKWKKESLNVIIFLGAGIATSIILLSKILSILFEKYPEYSYGIFTGLIIGGLLYLLNQINFKKTSNISVITISFIISFFLLKFAENFESTNGNVSFWYLILGGIVGAATMVLPGISGSSMLLIMGIYKPVIDAISNINLNILIPVGMGVILGLVLIIKLLEKLMEKFHEQVIAFLIGLTIAGTILIFPITSKWITYVFFVLGIFISKYLEKILNE